MYTRGVYALRDLTLTIGKGDFVFLTGPSGAGKSTLLRLLLRQDVPSAGHLIVGGRSLSKMSASQVQTYRRSVGFVFQDFKLIPTRTVYENITFVPRVLGQPIAVQRRKAFQVLKWVGLQHRLNAFPEELSGGEQQRVAVARALINDPALVLADEPTGNLDPDLALEIMNLFRDINARGTTVLVATHDRELIRRVGKRTVTLDQGLLVEGVMNAVVYAIGEAWRSMWRRRGESLMAVLTASASLFVLGLLLLAGASASNLLERWSAAAEFSVFLADGATPGERAAIERTLGSSGLVAGQTFVPAEEALRRFSRQFPDLAAAAASLSANPLPASYEVQLRPELARDPAVDRLAAQLRQQAGVSDVRYDRRWIERLLAFVGAARAAGPGAGGGADAGGLPDHHRGRAPGAACAPGGDRDHAAGGRAAGLHPRPVRARGHAAGVDRCGGGVGRSWSRCIYLRASRLVAGAAGLVAVGDVRFLPVGLMLGLVGGGASIGCLGGLLAARTAR